MKPKKELKKLKKLFYKTIVNNSKRVSGEPAALPTSVSTLKPEATSCTESTEMILSENNTKEIKTTNDISEKDQEDESQETKNVSIKARKRITGKFVNLRSSIMERLNVIDLMQNEQFKPRNSVVAGNSPKQVIAYREKMRQELSMMTDEWKALNKLYVSEINKRKSKLTPKDLEMQRIQLLEIKEYIIKMDDAKISGFTNMVSIDIEKTKMGVATTVIPETIKSYQNKASNEDYAVPLSDLDQLELEAIEEKDEELDEKLDKIDDLLSGLKCIANAQEEEMKRQNNLLDNIDRKTNDAQDKMKHNNRKVASTLARK